MFYSEFEVSRVLVVIPPQHSAVALVATWKKQCVQKRYDGIILQ
jgi:hypothetical protein